MKNKSKKIILDAIYKVVNSAPTLYSFNNYAYTYYQTHNYSYTNRNDISKNEFDTWLNYAYKILDISYNNTGLEYFLLEKLKINTLANQFNQSGVPYVQRVFQINKELLNLAQVILQH